MNILYLCDEYPPGKHGGIGNAVRLLALEMVRLGHTVVVAGFYSPGYSGEDEFEDNGVKVYRFRWRMDGKWFTDQQSLRVRISSRILRDMRIMEWDIKRSLTHYKTKLEKIITDNQIDIVEIPDYNDYMRFCKSYVPFPVLSAPVIVKMHGSITFTRKTTEHVPDYIVQMEQVILNQASAVSGVSKYVAAQTSSYLSYSGNVEVLYNGIDTNALVDYNNRNPKQVIYTGTLVRTKGIYQLAKAWNIVNKNVPDARLLILGKGSQEKVTSYLEPVAKETVTFTGHVKTEELCHHLSDSAISVFPSYSEAFALAPLEALACGAAVINSNRTSGPELIDDGVNGLLIDPDDVDQIASAILYLLNDTEACARLAKTGNEMVKENFSIGKIAADNLAFYNRVLEGIK